jgi:hypothetical protein
MKRNSILLIILAILIIGGLLAASIFWIDLRAAIGNTRAENQIASYSMGIEQGGPKPPINSLTVYVEEPWYLLGSVKQGVVKGIQDSHGIYDFRVADELPQTVDTPVLYVQVTPRLFFWLPFFTQSNLDMRTVYSSDGELAWMDEDTIIMTDSPSLRMKGAHNITDTTWGISTLRGQTRYLGRQVAEELLKAIDANLY